MTSIENQKEVVIKISVFSHPDDLGNVFIERLIQNYPHQATRQNASSESINISILQLEIENWQITIYISQPLGQSLIDKFPAEYYNAIAGAIILFSNNYRGSYKAARAFYRQLRKTNNDSSVPVTFVEVLEESSVFSNDESVTLSDVSHESYYGLSFNDAQTFGKIIGSLTSKYMALFDM
ncbi:MAG: hypothetical protein ACXAC8_11005 [Candidatus Hodarchaeales archaeon]|jgi:hypothetical protein